MNQRKPVAWRDPTNPTMICKDEHQLPLAEPVYAQMSHVTEPQSTEAMHGNNTVHRNGLCDVLRRHPRSGGGREDLEKLMAESQYPSFRVTAALVAVHFAVLLYLIQRVDDLGALPQGAFAMAAESQPRNDAQALYEWLAPKLHTDERKALDGIMAAVSEKQPRWIPVAERKPEKGGMYAVVSWHEGRPNFSTSWFFSETNRFIIGEATHWMSFPEVTK